MTTCPTTRASRSAEPLRPLTGHGRIVRIAALGSASLLLALVAHVAGGGGVPSPFSLVTPALAVGLLAALLTQRRCSGWVLAVVLAPQQYGLHEWFCRMEASHAGMHASHATHDAMTMPTPVATPTPSWMLAAHVLAIAATAWLLARGEALLWRTVDALLCRSATNRSPRRPAPARLVLPAAPALSGRVLLLAAGGPRSPPLG